MHSRLFDIVAQRAAEAPQATMLAAKEGSGWREWTNAEVWETAQQLAGGLLELGIRNEALTPDAQEKIAVICPNRPEWIVLDLAAQLCGAVLTPIYPTIAPAELEFILKEAAVEKVFVADCDIHARFAAAINASPTVKHVFCFNKEESISHWRSLLSKNRKPEKALLARIIGDTLATIIYTSGTTGSPKGVMLTHRNIVSNIYDSFPAFTFAVKGDKALSFLPLNHIFERTVSYIYLLAGLSIWYAESMETIGDNLREVQPMVFTTVPRLLEKVYERILSKGLELKGIKRALFFWALNLAKRFDNLQPGSAWYRAQLGLANRLVFSKWREALGGRVKAIVTGSAACQVRLIRIFSAAQLVIMEGYGLTETSPVISVNRFEREDRLIGSVGPLIDHVDVKLAEDGEILVRGELIMLGYYQRPEMTAEVLEGGWFHTGDIGAWVEGRFLKITDRKKEIFKTSGGKYVAPQPIENKMKESPYIEQIMVVGAGEKFVGALIVPSLPQLRRWLKEQGKASPGAASGLFAMPEIKTLIRQQLDKYNAQFGHVEQVKKFALLAHEWTIDGGELTPSLKLKRKVIMAKYAEEIAGIYS